MEVSRTQWHRGIQLQAMSSRLFGLRSLFTVNRLSSSDCPMFDFCRRERSIRVSLDHEILPGHRIHEVLLGDEDHRPIGPTGYPGEREMVKLDYLEVLASLVHFVFLVLLPILTLLVPKVKRVSLWTEDRLYQKADSKVHLEERLEKSDLLQDLPPSHRPGLPVLLRQRSFKSCICNWGNQGMMGSQMNTEQQDYLVCQEGKVRLGKEEHQSVQPGKDGSLAKGSS